MYHLLLNVSPRGMNTKMKTGKRLSHWRTAALASVMLLCGISFNLNFRNAVKYTMMVEEENSYPEEEISDVKPQDLPQRNNEDNISDEKEIKNHDANPSIQTISHFFSHIPKAGGTYALGEILQLFKSTVVHPNNRTDADIRSAQKRFNGTHVSDFFLSTGDEDWNNFPVDLEGSTDAYTPSMLCQWGLRKPADLKPYKILEEKNGDRMRIYCNVKVSEQPWQGDIENVYSLVREPLSHVLSQYFHCAESSSHAGTIVRDGKEINKHDLMPSLEDWLQAYEDVYNQASIMSPTTLKQQIKNLTVKFICYNPWNHQSQYTGFELPPHLPSDYTYPYPMDSKDTRDAITQNFDNFLFNDIKSRFRLIGGVSQMTKFICAMFIDSFQGKHIPEVCDCTHATNSTKENKSTTFCLPNRNKFPSGVNNKGKPDCSVWFGYKPSSHGHGVKHHGSSHLKTLSPQTMGQLHRIRSRDLLLYNISRAVFEVQIEEMEAEYSIRICDKFRQP